MDYRISAQNSMYEADNNHPVVVFQTDRRSVVKISDVAIGSEAVINGTVYICGTATTKNTSSGKPIGLGSR